MENKQIKTTTRKMKIALEWAYYLGKNDLREFEFRRLRDEKLDKMEVADE